MKVKDKSARLLIAGTGNSQYEQLLKNLASGDDRIQFLGYMNSQHFYKRVDVVVVPSLWEEPLGMVAVEACANNIPVITTGEGGLKEIIKEGVNGWIVDKNKDNSLYDVMRIAIEINNENKMNPFVSVEVFLSANTLINEYCNLYKYLI